MFAGPCFNLYPACTQVHTCKDATTFLPLFVVVDVVNETQNYTNKSKDEEDCKQINMTINNTQKLWWDPKKKDSKELHYGKCGISSPPLQFWPFDF